MNIDNIDKYLRISSQKKSILEPYKKEILFLKEKKVGLKGIAYFLIDNYEIFKKKYEGKEKNLIVNLSRFFRKQNSATKKEIKKIKKKEIKNDIEEKDDMNYKDAVELLRTNIDDDDEIKKMKILMKRSKK